MRTTQGWGWLAAGVLALGLNGFYQDGGAAWAHRALDSVVAQVAERSGALANLASERVSRFMERTSLVAERDETNSCRLAAAVARFQGKIARTQSGMAHVEAMRARQEAVLARVEVERARIEARVSRVQMTQVAFNTLEIPVVFCPRVSVTVPRVDVLRVRVPRTSMVSAPVVDIGLPGDGPI
jgi:hypothetical protein